MAFLGVTLTWYDRLHFAMYIASLAIAAMNSESFRLCSPLYTWIEIHINNITVFLPWVILARCLSSVTGLNLGGILQYAYLCVLSLVLNVLVGLLFPFLWVWTFIGTMLFITDRDCLPGYSQKLGFFMLLLSSYVQFFCFAMFLYQKWVARTQAEMQNSLQVLIEMMRDRNEAMEVARRAAAARAA